MYILSTSLVQLFAHAMHTMINAKLVYIALAICACIRYIPAYIVEPGPVVRATKGFPWPFPQHWQSFPNVLIVNPLNFQFETNVPQCTLITSAIHRYNNIINKYGVGGVRKYHNDDIDITTAGRYQGVLSKFKVLVKTECIGNEYPSEDMDESYDISIGENGSNLVATEVWGILRGLETFSQLLHYADDGNTLVVNMTKISDFPRFPFRGLLVDTSRHFIPKELLLKNLDAMAYNKLNVFHWHITDDHSFPYESIEYPELSKYGAYHPTALIYTQQDVKDLIEYARQRGIRVMPEFDTPGHTRSWGEGVSDILTTCYNKNDPATPTGQYGPLDPSSFKVYSFIKNLFQEIVNVFPEKYVHLGGDEVEFECWSSNPNIKAFMIQQSIKDYRDLESYYIQRLLDTVHNLGGQSLVWEEVFINNVTLSNTTIVHVWRDHGLKTLKKVIEAGKPALLSSCYYLDHLTTGGDWEKYYNCDPYDVTDVSKEQLQLILGGEACMWSESVNKYNFMSRIWPRASAVAEKLWSRQMVATLNEAAARLEEHTCRLNTRGIEAQPPNGPGYCL